MDRELKALLEEIDKRIERKRSLEEKIETIEFFLQENNQRASFEFLNVYIQYQMKKQRRLLQEKKVFEYKKDWESVQQQRNMIRKNKAFTQELRRLQNEILVKKERKTTTYTNQNMPQPKKDKNIPVLSIDLERVKKLDTLFQGDTFHRIVGIASLQQVSNEELLALQKEYYAYRDQVKEMYAYASIAGNFELSSDLEMHRSTVRHVQRYISDFLAYNGKMENKIRREKRRVRLYNRDNKAFNEEDTLYKSYLQDPAASTQKIDAETSLYLEQMNSGKEVTIENIFTYTKVLKYFVRNEKIDAQIMVYMNAFMNQIFTLEQESTLSKEEIEELLYSVLDTLDRRCRRTSKEDKKNRKILKDIQAYLKQYLAYYKTDTKKKAKEHYYYYDICKDLVNDPIYFHILEEILAKVPELINARDEEQHILVGVLDSYFKNRKWEMGAKGGIPIPSSHYRDVFKIFIKSDDLDLGKDAKRIKNMFDEFEKYILEEAKEEERGKMIDELYEMRSSKNQMASLKVKQTKRDIRNKLIVNKKSFVESSNRFRLTYDYLSAISAKVEAYNEEFLQTYGRNPYEGMLSAALDIPSQIIEEATYASKSISYGGSEAFSVKYNADGSRFLRMHEIDFDALCGKDAEIEEYLFDKFVHQEKSGFENSPYFHFQKGEEVPTITYQLRISERGDIQNFEMYRTISSADAIVRSMDGYRQNSTLKEHVSLYRILTRDREKVTTEKIETCFTKLFKRHLLEDALANRVPIIREKETSDRGIRQAKWNELTEYAYKITKEDYIKIEAVLKNPIYKKHYTNNRKSKGFDLPPATMNYLTVLDQRLMMNYLGEVKEALRNASIEAVSRANRNGAEIGNKVFQKQFK